MKPPRPIYDPWKPVFGKLKICISCKGISMRERRHVPTWTCRGCGVKCCEHLCSAKTEVDGGGSAKTEVGGGGSAKTEVGGGGSEVVRNATCANCKRLGHGAVRTT